MSAVGWLSHCAEEVVLNTTANTAAWAATVRARIAILLTSLLPYFLTSLPNFALRTLLLSVVLPIHPLVEERSEIPPADSFERVLEVAADSR
jgi:hypothetical protein